MNQGRAAPVSNLRTGKHQRGVFLIEALVAILIFSLGILGMVAMGATAVSAQSDAQYRSDADGWANEIASQIALKVDRGLSTDTESTRAGKLRTSLLEFAHQPSGGACVFSGGVSGRDEVTAWANKITAAGTGLPGAAPTSLQIAVSNNTADFNQVVITICWQAPTDKAMRKHMLVSYVN